MKASGLRGLARLMIIWLAIGTSCWGYPIIDVNTAFERDGQLGFSLERCTWPHRADVERLEIRPKEPTGSYPPSILCGLQSNDRGRLPPLDQWAYGKRIEGFTVIGKCPPLDPGTYRVVVQGSGSGSYAFSVAEGRVTKLSPHCTP
jgi:hypothetical protein